MMFQKYIKLIFRIQRNDFRFGQKERSGSFKKQKVILR